MMMNGIMPDGNHHLGHGNSQDLGRVLMLTMETVELGSDQLSYDMALEVYVAMKSSS